MMAWVEMAGLALSGNRASAWALRIGFIVLFAGSTWLLARLTSRYYGEWAGFLAAFALNVTGYYGLAASMFALPDGPLLFFWLLTIDRLSVALEEPDRGGSGPGSGSGLAWGGAMLSKYHAVFIPMGRCLYAPAPSPDAGAWLVQAGPLLGAGDRAARVQSGHHLERQPWLGVVPLPGGPGGGELDAAAGLSAGGHAGPGGLPVPVDLDAAGRRPGTRLPRLAENRLGSRAALALPGGCPPGRLHRGGVFPPGLAALGPDRTGVAIPDPGAKLGGAARDSDPEQTRRLLAACAAFSVAILAVAIGEYRYGWLQRDGHGGGDSWILGPIRRSTSMAGTRWPIGSGSSD